MICASCGTDNPGGAQFCGNCGAGLAAADSPPASPPTEPIPPVPPTSSPPPPPPGSDPTVVGAFPPAPPPGTDPTTSFAVPPAQPVQAPPEKKKSKRALLLGLLALLVVAAAVGSFLVLGGDDDGGGDEIVLEPIGSTLRDDFAGNLDLGGFTSSIANVLPGAPPLGSGIASVLSARGAEGDLPGLYGGSRDQGTCDVQQLVDFLTDDANADKAQAWADTLGIDVDEIEDFIGTLTPVRLRFDTRVTNHGFVDGNASAFQSILEAGTAVMVDDEGVPRVKCNCGNPLAEPEDLSDAGVDEDGALEVEDFVQNPDDAWDDFDPEEVVTVEAGDSVDEFILVDIETGELFVRPVGTDGEADGDVIDLDVICELLGDSPTCLEPPEEETTTTSTTEPGDGETTTTVVLGTGDVQITLEWFSNADLDLAVTDPTGEQISFSNRGPTATGGQLDVDSNIGCPEGVNSGVENIFWPPGGAPAGSYLVEVTGFSVGDDTCGGGDYVLTIRVAGLEDQVIRDSVAAGDVDEFPFVV
jgi:hypothetical protein